MVTSATFGLVGRERELEQIRSFVAEGAGALVLEGDAGIGKTSLWQAGVDAARESGLRVLEARAAAAETELSFTALADLLREVHDEIGYLPSPQRRALRIALVLEELEGEPPEQRAIAAAVLGLLRRLADDSPIVVALDDVHWLDPPSASALRYAIRRIENEPVRVLATCRSGPGLELEGADRLTIGPLELSALDRIVRERLGARFLRPTLRQIEEISGGNPFYALEIASSLLRSGERVEPGDRLPIPPSLRELVRERIALLTPRAQEATLVAAALAQPTVTTVQRALDGGSGALAEALDAGVLERDRDTLRFTHPLLALSVYEDSSPAERAAVHTRLAGLVNEPEERARHLAEAADEPDDEVASVVEVAAAQAAARGAPDVAATLSGRAVELTPKTSEHRHRRSLRRAQHLHTAGDPRRARVVLEEHLEHTQLGPERAETLLELSSVLNTLEGIAAEHDSLQQALRELGDTDAIELRARILTQLAGTDRYRDDFDSDASDRAVALARRSGNSELLARALSVHGMKLVMRSGPPPDEFWREALELEQAWGEVRFGGPSWAHSFALFLQGDFASAQQFANRVAEALRERGDPKLSQVLVGLCETARITGDFDAASQYAEEARDIAAQTGQEAFEPICVVFKARAELPRGDLASASRHAEQAIALVESRDVTALERAEVRYMAQCVFAAIALVMGDYRENHERITTALEIAQDLGPGWNHAICELLAGDVEVLVHLGRMSEARQQLKRLEDLAAAVDVYVSSLEPFVGRARGLVALGEGDTDAAVGHLRAAVDSFERYFLPWPFEHARTLLMLGTIELRARRKHEARKTLREALELFERIGARLWVEKTRAQISQLGGRPSRTGALTETEKRIAELVASGHSNAEVAHELFLSPKTVEWNLSKIYRKLHVRSRTELAAKLARHVVTS